jgi:hypothetical protein
MTKIGFKRELYKVGRLPIEVFDAIQRITNILEENYGIDRDIDEDMGGYIILLEDINDYQLLIDEINLNIENDVIPEFVDKRKCHNGEIFTNTLILCNNDFGIPIIMPLEITPENLKSYMID